MADTQMQPVADELAQIRESVRALCAKFPGEYWRALDRERAYPTEFVAALTQAGFLAALIPEEYGGSGVCMNAPAGHIEEDPAAGCQRAAPPPPMFNPGAPLPRRRAAPKAPAR